MHRIRLQIPARSPLLLPLARYPRLPAPNRRVYSTLPPLDFPNTLEPPTLPDPPNADLPTSPPHTAFDLPDTSDPTIPNFSDVQLTTWPANSYHIVLLIDFRESTHNKAFISKLLATGIAVEERSLLLGDMVWVARQNEGEEECVLNHIVERKRLDDLAGGILNGRLNEQKYRLKRCGLDSVTFLIEEHKASFYEQPYAPHLLTAITSLQTVDGFNVKRTLDLDDTVEYLHSMHEVIEHLHEAKPLSVIPDRHVSRITYPSLQTYLRQQDPSGTYLTSYRSFSKLNRPGSFTVDQLWGRMLMTVSRMSAEKADAVRNVYPTPFSLWKAFERADEEEANPGNRGSVRKARYLLDHTVDEVGRRKIGRELSGRLYDLFRMKSYD